MAMEEADDFNALVFDCGSSSMKIGYAGDIAPMYVVPSCIAANKREKKKFVGSIRDGLSPKDFLFENPIEKGQIVNWDDMMLMWEHAFGLLKIESTSKPVLLTESPLNCITNREKMVSVMFEKFKVPSLHISNASSLPLYATGRSTGIVLDCGDGLSAVVPTFEGSDMPPANERLNLAGAGVTDYLKQLLSNSYRTDIVQHIKEQVSYVPINFEKEMERPPAAVNYTLPDGKNILIGNERFMCTESLFVPSLTSMNLPEEGIHQLLHKSILKCNQDIRKELYANIVISGGTTFLPGFLERLKRELSLLAPKATINIIRPSDQVSSNAGQNATWIGGSILASLETFGESCISKHEYEECGISLIYRKFQ